MRLDDLEERKIANELSYSFITRGTIEFDATFELNSMLRTFIGYIYYWNLQFLNNVIIIKTKVSSNYL